MPEKHLRRRAVEEITGLSRSTIYLMMSRAEFPKPVHLTSKAVAWPESATTEWLVSRSRKAA
jgi:prophage regulatory protein